MLQLCSSIVMQFLNNEYGIIELSGTTANFSNCSFQGNIDGFAIRCMKQCIITIENTTFSSNRYDNFDLTIKLFESQLLLIGTVIFDHNNLTIGGSIVCLDQSIVVAAERDIHFTNNIALFIIDFGDGNFHFSAVDNIPRHSDPFDNEFIAIGTIPNYIFWIIRFVQYLESYQCPIHYAFFNMLVIWKATIQLPFKTTIITVNCYVIGTYLSKIVAGCLLIFQHLQMHPHLM